MAPKGSFLKLNGPEGKLFEAKWPRRGQTWLAPGYGAAVAWGCCLVPVDCNPASKRANLGGVLVITGSRSSRPTVQVKPSDPNPRLRRYAPYLGLTMWHLSEVLNCVTDLNVNCEL